MGNDIYRKSAAELLALGRQVHTTVSATPATFGVTAGELAVMETGLDILQTTMLDQEAAKAAARAATEAKEAAQQAVSFQISDMAATIYAKETLTNAQIASTGLQPRDTSRTKISPVEISDLVATAKANGSVTLSWNRNGNKYGVGYVIQTSTDGENWNSVFMTTKSRATLFSYPPGVVAYFRVIATKNDQLSNPSSTVSIYLAASGGSGMYVAA